MGNSSPQDVGKTPVLDASEMSLDKFLRGKRLRNSSPQDVVKASVPDVT